MTHILTAMRLVNMARRHPQQDNSYVCSECGERVGIYPSGQNALKRFGPDIVINCEVCSFEGEQPFSSKVDLAVPAARTVEEMQRENRDSYDVDKGKP